MAVGDVNVLQRIERRDRMADRAARKLVNKLAKKRRSRKLGATVTAKAPYIQATDFSQTARAVMHSNTHLVQRRASRATGSDGKRAFFAAEVEGGGDEEGGVVVAMPRTAGGTVDRLVRAITKHERAVYTASNAETLLFHADAKWFVVLRKLRLPDDEVVFYASCSDSAPSAPSAPPRALGLDPNTFKKLQRAAAKLAGWKLTDETRDRACDC